MIRREIRLSPADKARSGYLYVPFVVPLGTTRLDVRVAYRKAQDCIIDVGCADPRLGTFPSQEGFRGWSGGARDSFFVATDEATPGYVAGPIPPGEWSVVLGLYRVPERGVEVEVEVALSDAPRAAAAPPAPLRLARPGAGWYRGDLHCHTYHSDAKGAPETLHEAARQAGLDFLAVTDHNTVTARRYFDAAASPELVFVRGMEATTEHGHANVYGLDEWIDFRMERAEDALTLAAEVHARGGLLSVNHDKPDIPWSLAWPDADCMEVWQHPWLDRNWISLARWQERLAAGLRLPAIGGSDWHQPAELRPEGVHALARPTTVLWLPELSEHAVLAAMKAGRGYVTEAPDGPHLEVSVGDVPMGGTARRGAAVDVAVRGAAGDRLVLVDAGGPVAEHPIGSDDAAFRTDVAVRGFVRAEIVADASREGLLQAFRAAFPPPLPFGLTEAEIARQPLRRALSNPVWIEE